MDDPLSDNQRANFYWSLLRGMANDIRTAPGSCERIGHDWSRWTRFALERDSRPPVLLPHGAPIPDLKITTVSRRHCEQCGKTEQVDG
jgi:hypothetical protein